MTFSKSDMSRLSEVHQWAFKQASENGSRSMDVRAIPVSLSVELSEFEVTNVWSWKDRFALKAEAEVNEQMSGTDADVTRGFDVTSFVKCKGRLEKNQVSIFEFPSGTITETNEFFKIIIRPGPTGRIGGDDNHGPSSAHAYLGMGSSSLEIPVEGLMKGEIGSIRAYPKDDQYFAGDPDFALRAELYVTHEVFEGLVEILVTFSEQPIKAVADIVAQLFQHEIDAALSEPWHGQNYGLRVFEEERIADAPARLELLRLDRPIAGPDLPR